ncbi:hypothetical protein B0H13DRAFT_1855217 [Mycena leptocephala]|nr:hypothetical protein B0H13DRAFT_1855217 [Mycena leptocephala]
MGKGAYGSSKENRGGHGQKKGMKSARGVLQIEGIDWVDGKADLDDSAMKTDCNGSNAPSEENRVWIRARIKMTSLGSKTNSEFGDNFPEKDIFRSIPPRAGEYENDGFFFGRGDCMDRSHHRSLFQRKLRDEMALGSELRRTMSRDRWQTWTIRVPANTDLNFMLMFEEQTRWFTATGGIIEVRTNFTYVHSDSVARATLTIPKTAAVFPLKLNDWVLFDATLHKSGPRRYEVQARHLRVLSFIPPAVNASSLIPVVPSPPTGLTSSGTADQELVGCRKRRKTCRMWTGVFGTASEYTIVGHYFHCIRKCSE